MAIVSLKHKFIFVKTKKVAGTSVEALLREICGEEDIITYVTPRDEDYSIQRGYPSRNWACDKRDEERYMTLVSDQQYDDAMQFLNSVKKKYTNHMTAKQLYAAMRSDGLNYEDFYKFSIDRHPYTWMISMASYNNKKYNAGRLKPVKPESIDELVQKALDDPNLIKKANYHFYMENGSMLVDAVHRYEDLDELFNSLNRKIGGDLLDKSGLPDLKANTRDYGADVLSAETKGRIYALFEHVFLALDYKK